MKYDQIVASAITENLLAEGASKDAVDKYMQHCTPAIYRTTSERSIISQMNEMIMVAQDCMSLDKYDGIETNIPELNRSLNSFVMLKLPKGFSGKTMLDELRSFLGETQEECYR